jgi:hypothetical protein
MKDLGFLMVLAGAVLVYFMLKPREKFVSEFVDRAGPARTDALATSSYAQQTNHFVMTPSLPEETEGKETPFRVNQWNSYQPI